MTELTAREIFKAAYENRYTWDSNFPGYTAEVKLQQGEETYAGKISVQPDFTVEVTGIEDEQVKESIYTQLRDVVTHRKRSTFEKSHSKNEFSFGESDSSSAVEILVRGDAMGSNYKVRGKEICQVSRVMGRMAFTIDTKASLDTGSGYVSAAYDVVFRNPETQEVLRENTFADTYEKVGDYYLMTRQVIHTLEKGQQLTTEFNFLNMQLLEQPVAVSPA
jgi:hypothetical protein